MALRVVPPAAARGTASHEPRAMTFDDFLERAWDDHGDRPQEVADRLAASLHLVQSPAHVVPFAALVTHVFGEHLGRWSDGIGMLQSLRALPAYDGTPDVAAKVARNVATLRYAAGDRAVLAPLARDEQAAVLAAVAAAFAGRNAFGDAIAAYAAALAIAADGLDPQSPAIRALAVGGNNLAAALEAAQRRSIAETQAMVVAAESALKYWKLAGTWLEEERAEYRLVRSQLQAGNAAAAVQTATRCLAVCERNAAPAFELFFACAALAMSQRAAGDLAAFAAARARAIAHHDAVAEDARPWCNDDLEALTPTPQA